MLKYPDNSRSLSTWQDRKPEKVSSLYSGDYQVETNIWRQIWLPQFGGSGMLLVCSGQMPGRLPNTLNCAGEFPPQPQQRSTHLKMLVALKLRNPGSEKCYSEIGLSALPELFMISLFANLLSEAKYRFYF